MLYGLSNSQVEQELRSRGVQDETLIRSISEVIELNNMKLKQDLPRLLKEVESERKRVSLSGE